MARPDPPGPVIPEGAFVWANFPFGDPPLARHRPGPVRHIAYCLGHRSDAGRVTELMLAYTSSGAWRGAAPTLPIGVIEFPEAEAVRLNQRPFHIDLRCLARIPPGPAWLPDWDKPDRGVVAVAPASLRNRILREAQRLARSSPEIIEVRGIGSRAPGRTLRRPD